MTIYAKFGDKAKIVAKHGEHKPAYLKYPCQLVTLLFDTTESEPTAFTRPYWADFLRADEGYQEIKQAIDSAELINLSPADLKKAFSQAE